jgi:hypothetical protein
MLKYLALLSPLNLQMLEKEDIVVKPVPHKRRKQFFMWIRLKQCKKRKEMAGTKEKNLNLPH